MMYAKLIFKNAKRSGKDYLIYIVTMTLCVTLFYAFLSISSTHYHPTIGAEYNISLLAGGMKLAICGISLLLLFLIHYVNRFMLRKKQKEFAVEATLGMEQKTIGLLFFGETFFLLIFSVSVGNIIFRTNGRMIMGAADRQKRIEQGDTECHGHNINQIVLHRPLCIFENKFSVHRSCPLPSW